MLLKLHFKKFYKKIALKAVKVFLKPFEASQRSVKTKKCEVFSLRPGPGREGFTLKPLYSKNCILATRRQSGSWRQTSPSTINTIAT